MLFDDKIIGRQWRVKYCNLYTEDIQQSWTQIFAVGRHFKMRNAQVIRTQFPLKPAAGSTIHSGQGCTFDHICVDMDISDSEGFSENEHLERLFLQYTHYVAASRVTSLEGLQILSWNTDLISVNNDVRKHMEYLYNERKVHLCYTPVYIMTGLKCSFLNTRSLHKHFRSVETNHNLYSADIMFLAETKLMCSDPSDSYQLQGSKLHVEMTKTGMKTVDPHMVLYAMLEMQFGYWKSKREHVKNLKPYSFACNIPVCQSQFSL